MSRILVPIDNCWYEKLHTVAYYRERKIEWWIRQHMKWLFPDHIVFPFKKSIISKISGHVNDPDLAMIAKDFSAWSLIEVEVTDHPIKHVVEQTQTFRDGGYNPVEVATYVKKQLETHCNKRIAHKKLEAFFGKNAPTVLVIADAASSKWEQQLDKENIGFAVLEVFKNTRGLHVFRTFGDYPIIPVDTVHCRRGKTLTNVLEITGPFTFPKLPRNREVDVEYEGLISKWVVHTSGKNLIFAGIMNPLDPEDTYTLIRDKRNRYHFQRS